jgi:hypothetical protein
VISEISLEGIARRYLQQAALGVAMLVTFDAPEGFTGHTEYNDGHGTNPS